MIIFQILSLENKPKLDKYGSIIVKIGIHKFHQFITVNVFPFFNTLVLEYLHTVIHT